MRFRLRTLLILLAVLPPLLAGAWWLITYEADFVAGIAIGGAFITGVAYLAAKVVSAGGR